MDERKKDVKNEPEKCSDTMTISKEEWCVLKDSALKAQEYWDRLLRQQADIENIRKRVEKERLDFIRYANEGIIVDLLNVLDDLERTIELAHEKHDDVQAFLKGVEMILAHLYDLLKKHGVTVIDAQGKVFDPHIHEALMQVENPDVPEHTVVDILQKGYMLHDRVIRTAKVSVSKIAHSV